MEETKRSCSSKQRRKKIVVSGIGGIAGVFIFGGALAALSLIRNNQASKRAIEPKEPASPTQKYKTSNCVHSDGSSSSSSREEESEGLRSLLQTSSPSLDSPHCCRTSIEHDSSRISWYPEAKAIESKIVEERSAVEAYVDSSCGVQQSESENRKEKSTSDVIKDDGVSSSDYDESLPTQDGTNKDDRSEQREPVSTIEDGVPEITHANGDFSGENSSVMLKEEIEADEDDEDDDMERDGESFESTGDSSTESHSGAVWPAESIEDELLLLKGRHHVQITRQKIDKVEEYGLETMSPLAMENENIELLRPSSSVSSRLGFWLCLFLAMGLLYLLFAHHLPPFYHLNDSQVLLQE